jgi:hypothetical protein
MTEFKGINPDKKVNYNANRQGKGKADDTAAAPQEQAPTGDPYADLKMDPNHLMSLLATQAKLNMPPGVGNASIDNHMNKFATDITPERHARACRIMEQTYTQEFGKAPSPELLQDLVDDYLVGRPVVQNA